MACEKRLNETGVYLVGFGLVVGAAEKTVYPVDPNTHLVVEVDCHLRRVVALVVAVKSSVGAKSLVG